MDKKLSLSVVLTIAVFMLTVILFVIVLIDLNVSPSDPGTSNAVVSGAAPAPETDHPGQKIFKANCTPCHRMHQKLVGPALAGVLERLF